MLSDTYQKSLNIKEACSVIHRLLMKDGNVKWVKQEWATKFKDGKAYLSIGTVQDITILESHLQIIKNNP